MPDTQAILDLYFPEMRWRCLSLAADLDRIQRSPGGAKLLQSDPRLRQLRDALAMLQSPAEQPNRAERFLMLFSDTTPPPSRT